MKHLLFIIVLITIHVNLFSQSPCVNRDRQVLIELYNATNGVNWIENSNWNTAVPIDTWFGVVTNANGCVVELNLSRNSQGNNLVGSLPNALGNMTDLIILDLSFNENGLTGTIPNNITQLTNLEYLILDHNNLSGNIPNNIGNLSLLRQLEIDSNLFTGTIPTSIGNLINVERLALDRNLLSGTIPASIGNLINVKELLLNENNLSGTLPNTIGDLAQLESLVANNNQLSGEIPLSIGNLSNLNSLWLQSNSFSGNIPSSLTQLTNIETFDFNFNQLEGIIPDLSNLSELKSLGFLSNRFEFGDFENEYTPYRSLLLFFYEPQAKVNTVLNLDLNIGSSITLNTLVSGTENHYKWFKNGVTITTAPDSPNYTINNIKTIDEGVYHCEVTSDIVPGLTLVRNNITITTNCNILPLADAPPDVTICTSYTLPYLSPNNNYFTATDGQGIQLNSGDKITSTQQIFVYVGDTTCKDENSFWVTIKTFDCQEPSTEEPIKFQTFFTPNGDNTNETWKINGLKGVVFIYDRYGKLLKQIDAENGEWNGDFNGVALPSADYWYVFIDNENNEVVKGHFALKR